MLKASWGGGGRGMRVIRTRRRWQREVPMAANARPKAAFGKDEVYLEKLVERARHVEVQILGDAMAIVVHLFERDCSSSAATRRSSSARRPLSGRRQRAELCGYG
jgi:pyruvate carboxylase